LALIQVTVTGSIRDPEGNAGKGRVIFQLLNEIAETDSNEIISRRPIVKTLDASGDFAVDLYATNSTGSVPPVTAYKYTTSLEGAPLEERFFILDGGVGNISIADLLEIKPGSDLLTSPIMKIIRATADEAALDTTLQNDDILLYPLVANEKISFEFIIFWGTGVEADDAKWALTIPAGASGSYGYQAVPLATTDPLVGQYASVASTAFAVAHNVGLDATLETMTIIKGIVINGGTAGNLQFQFAKVADSGADSIRKTNSHLIVRRIF